MILSCHEVSLSFGVNQILKDISFNIEEHEKVALIGNNGAGKSTLFKILTGELAPDSGEVTISKDTSIGYLSQHPYMNSDATVYDELMDSKRDILRISDKLRELETQMKNASEEELPELYSTYDRLSQQFDRENGYAVQSEVTGVLSPADRRRALRWARYCSPGRTLFCWMSRPIIWISTPSPGWKISFSTIRVPC